MSLRKFRLGNLGKKLELQAVLKKELAKVDDAIDKVVGDKKVKIISKKSK